MNPLTIIDRLWQHPLRTLLVLSSLLPIAWTYQFTATGAANTPRFDTYRDYEMIFAAYDGNLTLDHVVGSALGHVPVIPNLYSLALLYLTDWNLYWGAFINLALAVIQFVLMALLLWRSDRELWHYLLPLALLIFWLRQNFNWTIPYNAQWHFSFTFTLLTMVLLVYQRHRWLGIGAALLSGFAAVLSSGGGIAAWGVGGAVLILAPQRRPHFIAIWGIGTAAAAYLYLRLSGTSDTLFNDLDLIGMADFALRLLGVVFIDLPYRPSALWIGLGGIGIVLVNLYLLRAEPNSQHWRYIWLVLTLYSIGQAGLVALGRYAYYGLEILVYSTWYTIITIPLWSAVIFTTIRQFKHSLSLPEPSVLLKLWSVFTLGVLGFMGIRYMPSTLYAINQPLTAYLGANPSACLERFIFSQDAAACPMETSTRDAQNQLAARQLTLFSTIDAETIVPAGTSDPVLVESHSAWLNKHTQTYLLNTLDPDQIYHLVPEMDDTIPSPMPNVYLSGDRQHHELAMALTATGRFWYLRKDTYTSQSDAFWGQLVDMGYVVTNTQQRGRGYLLSEVQRIIPPDDDTLTFDGGLQLYAITQLGDTAAACSELTLETVWAATDALPADYSLSIKLINAALENVYQVDGALSNQPTSVWVTGAPYVDRKTLSLPCELTPGSYQVYVAVYNYQTPNDPLIYSGGLGSPFDDLARIQDIEVTNPPAID